LRHVDTVPLDRMSLRVRTQPPSSPSATRRSPTKAPQAAGVGRWKVAMGTPVRKRDLGRQAEPKSQRLRRTTRPGTRKVGDDARGRLRRHHDARLIGERAATRGYSPTEGGDQRAGVRSALSVRAPASRAGSNGANLDASAPAGTPAVTTRPSRAAALVFFKAHLFYRRSAARTCRLAAKSAACHCSER
jgi:hypothetical protein